MDNWFKQIVEELDLGVLTCRPQQVSGGYMHKMYRIETDSGKYAVKVLNPVVMQRPDAMGNYERAERLEKVLEEHGLPIVPALEIKGRKMQCIDGRHFYVFAWSEGKVVPWNEITAGHCKTIGELLAGIHKLETPDLAEEKDNPKVWDMVEEKDNPKAPDRAGEVAGFDVDWAAYAEQAKENCPEIAALLLENLMLLYEAQSEYNASLASVPAITCICNGDMDSKNVLWLNGGPQIIDLECLDYGNPFVEMFILALSWSGGVVNNLDYDC